MAQTLYATSFSMRPFSTIIVGLILAPALAFAAQQANAPTSAQDASASRQNLEQKKSPSSAKEQGPPETKAGDNTAAGSDRKSDAKPASPVPPQKKPKRIVVRQGGASEPSAQIVTGMSAEKASAERQEAEKWLGAAEEDLKRLEGRPLDPQQQDTVLQIHNYMKAAHSALTEDDISRGHTLAMKARLLAEDLLKH